MASLSAEENITTPLRLRGFSRGDARREAAALLAPVGFADAGSRTRP